MVLAIQAPELLGGQLEDGLHLNPHLFLSP